MVRSRLLLGAGRKKEGNLTYSFSVWEKKGRGEEAWRQAGDIRKKKNPVQNSYRRRREKSRAASSSEKERKNRGGGKLPFNTVWRHMKQKHPSTARIDQKKLPKVEKNVQSILRQEEGKKKAGLALHYTGKERGN